MQFKLPYGLVIITNNAGAGQISESKLTEKLVDENSASSSGRTSGAVEGIERLLLALACQGVNLSDPRFAPALETAVEQLTNYL